MQKVNVSNSPKKTKKTCWCTIAGSLLLPVSLLFLRRFVVAVVIFIIYICTSIFKYLCLLFLWLLPMAWFDFCLTVVLVFEYTRCAYSLLLLLLLLLLLQCRFVISIDLLVVVCGLLVVIEFCCLAVAVVVVVLVVVVMLFRLFGLLLKAIH